MQTRKQTEVLADYGGWLGVFLLLVMFGVNSFSIPIGILVYQSTNFAGAILVSVSAIYKKAWPAAFLNVMWAIIAILVMIREML